MADRAPGVERLARALFVENCDDEWEDCDQETQAEYRRDARERVTWLIEKGLALYDPATHVAVTRETADFLLGTIVLGMMKFMGAYPDDASAKAAFDGRFAIACRELGATDA